MSWAQHTARPYLSTGDFDYQIGATSGNMLRLRDMGIPMPDQVLYRPFSTVYTRGDMSRVGDGVSTITWTWDVLGRQELNRIIALLFAARTTTYVTCYIRSDYRTADAANPAAEFENFTCTLWRPNLFGDEGTPIVRSAYGLQSVRLTFVVVEVTP